MLATSMDMMDEMEEKGIIQRVIDQIFQQYSLREEINQHCEIKISFIEIYKETITDLLEEYNHSNQMPTGRYEQKLRMTRKFS